MRTVRIPYRMIVQWRVDAGTNDNPIWQGASYQEIGYLKEDDGSIVSAKEFPPESINNSRFKSIMGVEAVTMTAEIDRLNAEVDRLTQELQDARSTSLEKEMQYKQNELQVDAQKKQIEQLQLENTELRTQIAIAQV